MAEKANVVWVREFLNFGSNNPVSMTEMQEFWKSCSTQEREEFGRSAKAQLEKAQAAAA